MSKLLPTKEKILSIAQNNGNFTVNRNSYRSQSLRNLLKRMSKDKKCPLRLASVNQREMIFKFDKAIDQLNKEG